MSEMESTIIYEEIRNIQLYLAKSNALQQTVEAFNQIVEDWEYYNQL